MLRELGVAPGAMLSPCLAKRLPFDTPLEKAELKLIEDGERLLRGLRLDGCYLYLHGGSRASPHGGIRRLACWPQHRIV